MLLNHVILFKHNDVNNVPKSCKVHLCNIRPVFFLYVFTCMKMSLFVQIETFSHLRLYLFHYVIKHIDKTLYFVSVLSCPGSKVI